MSLGSLLRRRTSAENQSSEVLKRRIPYSDLLISWCLFLIADSAAACLPRALHLQRVPTVGTPRVSQIWII